MFNGENIKNYFWRIENEDCSKFSSFCSKEKIKLNFNFKSLEDLETRYRRELNGIETNWKEKQANQSIQIKRNFVTDKLYSFKKQIPIGERYYKLVRFLNILSQIKSNVELFGELPDEKIEFEPKHKVKLTKQQSRIKELLESEGKNLLTDKFDNRECLNVANKLQDDGLMKKDSKTPIESVRSQIERTKDKLKISD